ncbi:hypothetical protein [uncultured Halomonas sp.]|uniref:hypothetical protein n=1 Tax=uncultured Halomonas sp. TaxID=173971 RepID=UPI002610C7AE|nr:hypothetical protein [uncultured Halomonas sp.]
MHCTISFLLFGMLVGAGGLTLFATPSPVVYDRLLVAALGAASGLIATGTLLALAYGAAHLLGGK